MKVSCETARELMGSVFDKSYFSHPEEMEGVINEVVDSLIIRETSQSRLYKVEELKAFDEGTIFEHSRRGRCWIVSKADGTKCMAFETGGTMNMAVNNSPWDQPMRLIYTPKK